MSLLSAFVVLAAVVLAAAEAAAVTVRVDKPAIEILGRAAISVKCDGVDRLACTSIAARVISACPADHGQWRPLTMVSISSHVFASRADLLTHEFSHIADVRKAVEARARSMESHAFASEDECFAFVLKTDSAMPMALLEIEAATDRKRDPRTAFARPTPLAAEISGETGRDPQGDPQGEYPPV